MPLVFLFFGDGRGERGKGTCLGISSGHIYNSINSECASYLDNIMTLMKGLSNLDLWFMSVRAWKLAY